MYKHTFCRYSKVILTKEADFLSRPSQILLLLQQLHQRTVKSLPDPFTRLETTKTHYYLSSSLQYTETHSKPVFKRCSEMPSTP